MKKLIQHINDQFPELSYCGTIDKSNPQSYEEIKTSFSSNKNIASWLDWIKTTKQSINYTRIHIEGNLQIFLRKIDATRHLILLNEKENTTQLISFMLNLDYSPESEAITPAPKEDTKQVESKLLEAVRIQKMIIPKEEDISKHFKKFFVVHQQQDVVGGDFYWHAQIGNKTLLALIDCTGHSIEGAMTSMIVNTILNQLAIQANSKSPSELLIEFYMHLNSYNEKAANSTSDYGVGAEIGLFCFDYDQQNIKFSSTGIPAFIKYSDKVELLKPKKVLDYNNLSETLSDQSLEMTDVQGIYCFTDGVSDQFDASDRKKLGRKGIQKMIEEEGAFNANYYRTELNNWKGSNMQYDDMTLLGLAI